MLEYQSLWQLPKQLRFRIEDHQLRAEASTNLGEFVLGAEIIELLRLLDGSREQRMLKLHNDWVNALKEASLAIPSPGDLPGLLADLQEAGVLKGPKHSLEEPLRVDRFADAWIQWAMLADINRVTAYERALNETVKAGDSVLDLGAGTGILSFLAARAGAGKILALEESAAAVLAEKIFRCAAGHRGKEIAKPQVLRSNSSDALKELTAFAPRVLVSELFGHDPLSEGILPTLREVQGELGPQLVSIPDSVTVIGQFVTLDSSLVVAKRISDWAQARRRAAERHSRGKTDDAAALGIFQEWFCRTEDWSSLSFPYPLRKEDFLTHGAPIPLLRIPLAPVPAPSSLCSTQRVNTLLPRLGPNSAFIIWFEAKLSANASLSSNPSSPIYCSHWNPLIVPLWTPAEFKGTTAEIEVGVDTSLRHVNLDISSQGQKLGSR